MTSNVHPAANRSVLHSGKLVRSPKPAKNPNEQQDQNPIELEVPSDVVTRKHSVTYKIHHGRKSVARSNGRVAELTMKFNELSFTNNNTVATNGGVRNKSVRHCGTNYYNSHESVANKMLKTTVKIGRKPSVKTKPILIRNRYFRTRITTHSDVIKSTTNNSLVPPPPPPPIEQMEIVSMPAILPQRRSESQYETLYKCRKMTSDVPTSLVRQPNSSFLWGKKQISENRNSYDYCTLSAAPENNSTDGSTKTDDLLDVQYEYCAESSLLQSIYEVLDRPNRVQNKPLPPLPSCVDGTTDTDKNTEEELFSNCYESIYSSVDTKPDLNYEILYNNDDSEIGTAVESVLSSDQMTNSLYGRNWSGDEGSIMYKTRSELSSSDRSDDWMDVTDPEDGKKSAFRTGIKVIRERQKMKKVTHWSQQCREQWSKYTNRTSTTTNLNHDADCDHLYESLYCCGTTTTANSGSIQEECIHNNNNIDEEYDSLDEDENNCSSTISTTGIDEEQRKETGQIQSESDGGTTISSPQQQYDVLTRFATEAGRKMSKLRRNWSLTKCDIGKSLSLFRRWQKSNDVTNSTSVTSSRNGFLTKFRRSIISVGDDDESDGISQEKCGGTEGHGKSTFYLPPSESPPPVPPKLPPPPPKQRSASWYAEVGLFKGSSNNNRDTSWYSESGLYPKIHQNNNSSTDSTSSAENSGVLHLENEPLYQFYDAAVLESICASNQDTDDEYDDTSSTTTSDSKRRISDYSDNGYYEEVPPPKSELVPHNHQRPTVLELISNDYTTKTRRVINNNSYTKSLWCQIPEVIQSTVLSNLSNHQNRLQEAKFEILTSEASYFNSLNVLQRHFIRNLRKSNNSCISPEHLDILFGQLEPVLLCTQDLLKSLEQCWQDSILLNGIFDVILEHLPRFQVYIEYCVTHIEFEDVMRRIRQNPIADDLLKKLEAAPICQSLSLHSFLMLPMQRVTRWPLLLDAVLKRLSAQDAEYVSCQKLLTEIYRLVTECNEAVGKREKERQLRQIVGQLEYAKGVPPMDLGGGDLEGGERWLVRFGTVTHLQSRNENDSRLTFGKRFHKQILTLLLFTDYLFVTKIKSENTFTVLHYCRRNLVELTVDGAEMTVLPNSGSTVISQNRHLMFLTLLENQQEKTIEFLLSCDNATDRERWIDAFTPPKSEDPDEVLYESWDCPQVTALHNYTASQSDELSLSKGDVINVLKKMTDGWYYGERLRDGKTGWFPANHTVEIANRHVRSRNLKQRHRLLTFFENYLKSK